jgi:hypothetical protein
MPKKRAAEESSFLPKTRPGSEGAKTGMIRARVAPELKAEAERRPSVRHSGGVVRPAPSASPPRARNKNNSEINLVA